MRSRIEWISLFALLSIFSLAGCGTTAGELQLSEKDRQAELKAGETFTVTLPGNPTTGYTWEPSGMDEKLLARVGEADFKSDSKALGSGGVLTLRFKALAPGSTLLKLVYHRPWEKDQPPLKTFELPVTIR